MPSLDTLDSTTLAGGAVAVLTASLLVFYYRKSSKGPALDTFPGPKPEFLLGNVRQFPRSHWPKAFNAWKDEYGDVVYLRLASQPLLVLNRLEDADELLNKRANVWSGRNGNVLVNDFMDFGWSIIQVQPSPGFYEMRKVFRKVIGPNAIGDYDQLIEKEAEGLVQELAGFSGNPHPLIQKSVGKVIVLVAYGEKVWKEKGEELVQINTEATELVTYAFSQAWIVNIFPITRYLPYWFPGLSYPAIAQKGKEMFHTIRHTAFGMVKEAIDKGEEDFSVTSKYLSDSEFSSQYLRDSMSMMYFGAVDTTSTAVLNFLCNMLMFPEVQKKVHKELDDIVGRGNTPNAAAVQSARYLKATWKESLRFLPPIPTSVPHASTTDDTWKGRFIPKGTLVFTNIAFMLQDPRLWGEDSDQFKPERHLPELNPRFSEQPDMEAVFGFGRRICPGRYLADRNGLGFVASLMSAYEILPLAGEPVPTSVEFGGEQILRPSNLQVRFSARK